MINQERVQLLVDALRSGEYVQGYNQLCSITPQRNKHYCCLGVACEVARKNGLDMHVSEYADHLMFAGAVSVLPQIVQDWYGFEEPSPRLAIAGESWTAITWNDDFEKSFDELAQAFEDNFLGE